MKNALNNDEDISNNEINEYAISIINYKLKTNLSSLISILENKFTKTKMQIFNLIKNSNELTKNNYMNISSENINNKLKTYLVFHNIQKNCNNLIKLYSFIRIKKKSKFFSEWKNKIFIEKINSKIENDIKEKYNKLYKSQISNVHSSIKKNEKALEDLKLQEKKIAQNIKLKEKQKEDEKKKCNELEQKIDEVKKLNEKLEKEKLDKENLTNSNNTFSSMNNRKEGADEIIKELENKIIELDTEKNERDNYFQNFYDEMINMMSLFEQKTQKIMKMQNAEHPQKKLEINTGTETYDTNIRSKSKNKINSGIGSNSTTHSKKTNDNNREIFINYTDNFRNKI